jgi:methylated-DNA-[protein]-cysteine S-methyltransferase
MIESESRQHWAAKPDMYRRVDAERDMSRFTFKLERVANETGTMLIVTDDDGFLRALDWEDYESRMHRLLRLHYGERNVTLVEKTGKSSASRAVTKYLSGELTAIDAVPVKTGGTEFQRQVWAALRTIPVGETTTYGALAVRLERPKAVRAVGLANGANPVGVVVPCHRVIGADSSLTGYGGGLERKRWLLEHEGVRLPLQRRVA